MFQMMCIDVQVYLSNQYFSPLVPYHLTDTEHIYFLRFFCIVNLSCIYSFFKEWKIKVKL